jgi:hypothetical protein
VRRAAMTSAFRQESIAAANAGLVPAKLGGESRWRKAHQAAPSS